MSKKGTPARFDHVSCEFLVTGLCNLVCAYCIAKDLPPVHMDEHVGRAAVQMFVELAKGAKSIEAIFTGGEPLLNLRLVEVLTSHLRDLAQRSGMTVQFVLKTNGTILTADIGDFLLRHNFRTVVSLDGDSTTHDCYRRSGRGKPTYSGIAKNISTLIDKGVHCSASFTVHPSSIQGVVSGVQKLHELGVRHIDVAPAYGTVTWSECDAAAFVAVLHEIAKYMRDVNSAGEVLEVGPLYRASEHVNDQLTQCWGCGAGSRQLAFLPDGRIAGCSALAMLVRKFPDLVVGHVDEGMYEGGLNSLCASAQAERDSRPSCVQCNTQTNCAGGCIAINYASNSGPLTPPRFYCSTIGAIPAAWRVAWETNSC